MPESTAGAGGSRHASHPARDPSESPPDEPSGSQPLELQEKHGRPCDGAGRRLASRGTSVCPLERSRLRAASLFVFL
jgi:hypothetical protein